MESILSFFKNLGSIEKFSWIVVCITVLWIFENAYPFFKEKYNKWEHAKPNIALLSGTMIIHFFSFLFFVGVFVWISEKNFGLLNMVELPVWVEFILGILIFDFFAQYVAHYFLHHVPFLWRFHKIHHSDTHVDVTTGTRHHPGDYLVREAFALIALTLGGIPIATYLAYKVITPLFTYWVHSNTVLPIGLERVLNSILVTPNVHKFHHHHKLPWTDTNYGGLFSIWDRFFGTFIYENPKDIVFGVDTTDASKSNDFLYLLKLPFTKQQKVTDRES